MTQEELKSLWDKNKDDWDGYEKAIEDAGGERFVVFWQDYMHDACHVEEDMIEYMKNHGFVILDDPSPDSRSEFHGWIVFPPKDK